MYDASDKYSRGFTLLELLVVMTIMVALIGVIAPAFSRALQRAQLRAELRQLVSLLQQARTDAVRGGREVIVVLDEERRRFIISGDGDPRMLAWPDSLDVHYRSMRASDPVATTEVLHFFPDGSASGGKLAVSGEGARYAIDVDWLTGQVAIARARVEE